MSSPVHDSTPRTPPVGGGPTPIDPPSPPPNPPETDDTHNPAAQAFARIKGDLEELKEYGSYYVATKVDGVKRTIRNVGLYAALGVVGLTAGGAIVATAAGLLIVGLAEGLGRLFGDRYWLGDIVAGLIVLGVVGGAAWFMMRKLTGAWRSQTVKKYEQRKQSQRERFGHDLSNRAAQAPGSAKRPQKGH